MKITIEKIEQAEIQIAVEEKDGLNNINQIMLSAASDRFKLSLIQQELDETSRKIRRLSEIERVISDVFE